MLTDPSREMGALLEWLDAIPDNGGTTWSAIGGALGIGHESPELLEVLSVAGRRIDGFKALITTALDAPPRDGEIEALTAAASRLGQVFTLPVLAEAWGTTKRRLISPKDGYRFYGFSSTAERLWPLRAIGTKDVASATQAIDGTIAELEADANLKAWVKAPLIQGLARLRLVLRHLTFFGHDAALEELMVASRRAEVVIRNVDQHGAAWKAAKRTLGVLGIVYGLFVGIPEAANALETYKGWLLEAAKPMEISDPPKQLTGPKEPLDEESSGSELEQSASEA